MDSLRIILILCGIVLVAGIWLADRYKRRIVKAQHYRQTLDHDVLSDVEESFTTVAEPLSDEWVGKAVSLNARRHQPLIDEQLDELKGLNGAVGDHEVETPAVRSAQGESLPEEVIVLTVMAGEAKYFRGPLLLKVLQEVGLTHGEMGLFHYHLGGGGEPLFSVANILEPGRFELSEIAALQTPGLLLFMRLPTQVSGEQALQTLLQKARQIAAQLGAILCDEQRLRLTDDKLAELEQKAGRYTAS